MTTKPSYRLFWVSLMTTLVIALFGCRPITSAQIKSVSNACSNSLLKIKSNVIASGIAVFTDQNLQTEAGTIYADTSLIRIEPLSHIPAPKGASCKNDNGIVRVLVLSRWLTEHIETLRASLTRNNMTAPEYHEVRKAASGLVTLLDSYKQIFNESSFDYTLKVLATINGKMGKVHDGLTAGRVAGKLDYEHAAVSISADIKRLIKNFVDSFQVN